MIRARSDRGIIPPEAWGQGSQVDWERNVLYGADGIIYRNIELRRVDIEAILAEVMKEENILQ